jgi:hypothetical protein
MLLFQISVEKVQGFGEFWGTSIEGLFEEIAGSFKLCAAVPGEKFG